MEDRGRYWKKMRWFSFCSMHRDYEKTCKLCNTGSWINVWKLRLSNILHTIFPRLWIWYINKDDNVIDIKIKL